MPWRATGIGLAAPTGLIGPGGHQRCRRQQNWRRGSDETSGVLQQRMTQTWILVGDGSHARLFQTAGAAEPWSLVRKIDREHSRENTHRSESHEDPGEHAFARQLVGELETARQNGTFTQLVLVAPPKFLGQLRGELGAPLTACVLTSVNADYSQMSEAELTKHIDLHAKA